MILPLWNPVTQFEYLNGSVLVGGSCYVYFQGRTRLATVYKDTNGTVGPNPARIDANGRVPVYVDSNYTYTVVFCDARGKELFSQDLTVDDMVGVNDLGDDAHIYIVEGDHTIQVSATSGANWTKYALSTFNKPLGVQSPLYWAQDDEECSIIGASGLATTEELAAVSAVVNRKIDTTAVENALSGKVNVNDFTAYQEDIESAFGAVSDDVNALSGAIDTKLDSATFAGVSGSFLTAHQSLDGYLQNSDLQISDNKITGISGVEIKGADLPADVMTEDKISYDGNGKISAYNGSAFVGEGGGGSQLTAGDYIDITNDIISVTGLQVAGDYATHSDLTGLATKNEVNDKLDESAFANVSGSFYSTANPSGFITGVDLNPYQEKSAMTAYQSVEDMSAYQPVGNYQTAGDYYSASNPSGFLVPNDITGKQDITGMTAYQLSGDYATNSALSSVSSTITAMIPSGEFELCAGSGIELVDDPNAKTTTISVTAQGGNPEVEQAVIDNSATWNEVTAKADVTALSNYQTTAGMTAYLTTGDSANFYTTANESGFITGIPAGTMNESAFGYDTSNNITAYNGSAFKAGDELPSGVMNTSALEYNAVNEISGYNGSAIAQYGAEKQWLTHDDTIVHVSNSAQYAFGVNLSGISADLARMMGVDETVLWSGSVSLSANPTITANESVQNFEKVEFVGKSYPTDYDTTFGNCLFNTQSNNVCWMFGHAGGSNGAAIRFNQFRISASNNILAIDLSKQFNITGAGTTTATTPALLTKIVGIGRKS